MAAKTKQPGWGSMISLACVPLLMVLGNAVLIPVLPDIQAHLHVTEMAVSLLITLFSVSAGIAIPFLGALSDSVPRKWIVIPSLLIFGVGGIGAGLAALWLQHPFSWILGSRVLQGIGASGTAPIAMATVADLYKGSARSRALGINEAGNALGKVISPILGSLVALLSWSFVFFIFPILCVPLALALWFFVPKIQPKQNFSSIGRYLSRAKQVFSNKGKQLITFYLFGGVTLFSLFGFLVFLSEILESQYGIGGLKRGLLISLPLLTLTLTALIIGVITRGSKKWMQWCIIIGLSVETVSFGLAPFTANSPWLLMGFGCTTALGTGCVLPCLSTQITSLVDSSNRGLVTSFYGTARFLGVAAGPPVFLWLAGKSVSFMFWSVTALIGICTGLAMLTVREFNKPTSSEKCAYPAKTRSIKRKTTT